MLLRFRVKNFLSFHKDAELSMVAGRTRQLPSHLISSNQEAEFKVLKSAIIYGANASGKSNLIKSIDFARKFIVKGAKPDQAILVNPFRLNSKSVEQPSEFEFEFKISETIYSYGFSLSSSSVIEEWLLDISTSNEKKIFQRKTINYQLVEVDFGNNLINSNDPQFLGFVARGTRPNQLFLTECKERNVSYFNDIYNWFRDNITIIFPDTRPFGMEFQLNENKDLGNVYCDFLKYFNTGITGIDTKEIDFEKDLTDVPDFAKNKIREDIKSNRDRFVVSSPNKRLYGVYKNNFGEMKSVHLLTKHVVSDTMKDVLFELSDESDGTQRLIDLIPALMQMRDGDKVVLVDELDRSLHPILLKSFLKLFYNITSKSKSQLIITTHESSLLDLKLIRKDEIWFSEKNKIGESTIYSLEEFKPRFDKDIRKGYLLGRFGGIPVIKGKIDLELSEKSHA